MTFSNLILFFLALSTVACSSKKKEGLSEKSTTVVMAHRQFDRDLVTEVDFKLGSSILTSTAQTQLKELHQRALSKGSVIEEVRLMSEADEEVPEGEELPFHQQKLIEKRNGALERAIKSLDDHLKVTKLSMRDAEVDVQAEEEGEAVSHAKVIYVLE